MVKHEEKYGCILNKNSTSKYTEIYLMMTQYWSKHVVININVNNLCYYFLPELCSDLEILFLHAWNLKQKQQIKQKYFT
jgi:hypothetical protein